MQSKQSLLNYEKLVNKHPKKTFIILKSLYGKSTFISLLEVNSPSIGNLQSRKNKNKIIEFDPRTKSSVVHPSPNPSPLCFHEKKVVL